MGKQQGLLAPSRERALAGVRNSVFNKGTSGLSVGATGMRPGGGQGLMASNPEMEAYFNSIAQQDAQLATQAMGEGRNQVTFGQGLLGSGIDLASLGYNPLKTQLGLGSTIEDLGAKSLGMGSELGGRVAQAGQGVGQSLLQGGMSAAKTLQGPMSYSGTGAFLQGVANNPQFTNWAGGQINGMFGSQNQSGWGGWQGGLGTGYAAGGDQLYG
jgi:hypothetical protein